MTRAIRRLLIANRGEIAVRISRTCRMLGVETVAVFSDADRHALHVAQADRAVRIGPAPAGQSYLDAGALIGAAQATACDAVHPGYGFLAERAAFAAAVVDAGLIWIGPTPSAMEQLGDKARARSLAIEGGIPVLPGAQEALSDDAIARVAAEIGFPLVLKAVAGGGGRGMRVVRASAELPDAIRIARSEASSAFGDDRLLVERWVERGRHVEVQIVGTYDGRAIPLGTRDCSVQRRHQKVIEEAPAPSLPPTTEAALIRWATVLFERVGYQGAGTAEFLFDVERGAAYFLEVNTRLQVEHPVTEAIFGVDLVAWQIAVARAEPLPAAPEPIGHAVEVRVYAEDPITMLPATGRVTALVLPSGPGIRVDSAVRTGDFISPHYDPLIAKIIAQADRREAALDRLLSALRRTAALGTVTNLPLLQAVCADYRFSVGAVETAFLERQVPDLQEAILRAPDEQAWSAILEAWSATARPGRGPWRQAGAWSPAGRLVTPLQARDPAGRLLGERTGIVPPPGVPVTLAVRRADGSLDVAVEGVAYHVDRPRPAPPVSTGGRDETSRVVAPMPGTVRQLLVEPDAVVEAGQTLVVLEAMKLQHQLTAPSRAKVDRVCCAVGDLVAGGATLVELGPTSRAGRARNGRKENR